MRSHQEKEKAVVDTHLTISMRTSKVSHRVGSMVFSVIVATANMLI